MVRFSIAALAFLTQLLSSAVPFQPWGPRSYAIVNAVEFSRDGQSMFVALYPAQVAELEGGAPSADGPEVALYESRRDGDRWSRPQLLPFAGTHKDYEGTLSPDGQTMIFNSLRPLPDGRRVANDKNNLWMVRRTPSGWSAPIYLAAINRFDSEESYAAIGPANRVLFVSERPADAVGADYDLYLTRIAGDNVEAAVPFAPAATPAGEGDPWYARDGSYVVFTRWDRAKPWEQDADLVITFARGSGWTVPVPLSLNDPKGPDYALSIAGTPETVYWKRGGRTFHAPWAPVLAEARERAFR